MGLRDRILCRMDLHQRIALVTVMGLSLLLHISLELYILGYYPINFYHMVQVLGLTALALNPQGIRMLFFCYFTYLLMTLLSVGSYLSPHALPGPLPAYFFGLPLLLLGVSAKLIVYLHLGMYAILAYFSFKNPFLFKKKNEPEVLDHFE